MKRISARLDELNATVQSKDKEIEELHQSIRNHAREVVII